MRGNYEENGEMSERRPLTAASLIIRAVLGLGLSMEYRCMMLA